MRNHQTYPNIPANSKGSLIRRLSGLIVGARIVRIPSYEKPMRPTIDADALHRLQNIMPDADPVEVLNDLDRVLKIVPGQMINIESP